MLTQTQNPYLQYLKNHFFLQKSKKNYKKIIYINKTYILLTGMST